MSEEVGQDSVLKGETHSWAPCNSENSGGSDGKSTKKPMESCSNSPTATPTDAAATSQKRSRNKVPNNVEGSDSKACKDGESDLDIHIWTERERRKKMRNMFSALHSLLPQLPSKADKSTIVDEAINYIKLLQHSLQKLEKQRLEMMLGSSVMDYEASMATSPALTSESRVAFLADHGSSDNRSMMNSTHGLSIPFFPQSLQTWSSPNVVLSVNGDDAQISICTTRKPGLLTAISYILEKYKLEAVTAHIVSDCLRSMIMIHVHANGVSDQCPEPLAMEEIFKMAVGEIVFWLSS